MINLLKDVCFCYYSLRLGCLTGRFDFKRGDVTVLIIPLDISLYS